MAAGNTKSPCPQGCIGSVGMLLAMAVSLAVDASPEGTLAAVALVGIFGFIFDLHQSAQEERERELERAEMRGYARARATAPFAAATAPRPLLSTGLAL